MLKKPIFIVGAVLLIGRIAMGIDMFYQAPDPSVAGSWHTLGNWYYDAAMTISATALPTTSDTVLSIRDSLDIIGVDLINNWPLQATIDVGSYFMWTEQVINISDDANCNDFRIGGGTWGFTRSVVNVTNNSTLYVNDDTVLARRDYDSVELNIEAGSTVQVNDNHEAYGAYRGIVNVAGQYLIGDNIEMNSSNGWAMPGYLGDLYYQLPGDFEPTTHTTVDGKYPMDYAEWTINILAGGYVEADAVTDWNIYGTTLPGGEIHLYGDGQLVLRGNHIVSLGQARAAGLIWGDDIPGGVAFMFDGTNTTVLVPEPTTMLILGLGAFGLIQRRKT